MQTQQARTGYMHVFLVDNPCFAALIGLQALSIFDALTTLGVLSLPGGFETNPLYFSTIAVKALALCGGAFLFLNWKTRKLKFLVISITLVLNVLWISAIVNNLSVIWSNLI